MEHGIASMEDTEGDRVVENLPLVPHVGAHGCGHECNDRKFACDGLRRSDVITDKNGDPMVRLCDDGVVDPTDLACARECLRLFKEVEGMFAKTQKMLKTKAARATTGWRKNQT
jgi:hypothetical protein